MGKTTGNPNGRPSDYTTEKAENICALISNSEKGLNTLKKENPTLFPDIVTLFRWLDKHEDFRKLYARAREAQAEYMRDSVLSIADDSSDDNLEMCNKAGEVVAIKENREFVNRSRLRCEVRLRLMGKLYPKVYGMDSEKNREETKDSSVIIVVKKDGLQPVAKQDLPSENQQDKK